jgi:hypothetical protein
MPNVTELHDIQNSSLRGRVSPCAVHRFSTEEEEPDGMTKYEPKTYTRRAAAGLPEGRYAKV